MKAGEGKTIRLYDDTYQSLNALRKPHESWNVFLHRFLKIPFNAKHSPKLAQKYNEEIKKKKKGGK